MTGHEMSEAPTALDGGVGAEQVALTPELTPPGAGDATAGTPSDRGRCLQGPGFNSRPEGPQDCPGCGWQMAHVVDGDGTVSLQCQNPDCLPMAWLAQEADGSLVGRVILRDCPDCGHELHGTLYESCTKCGWNEAVAS